MAHASIGTALPQYGEVVSIKYRGTQVGSEYKTPRYAGGRWVVSIKHRDTQVGFRIFFVLPVPKSQITEILRKYGEI